MELNEKELDDIITKISQLASKINVGTETDSKTDSTLANSVQVMQSVEKSNTLIKNLDNEINKTSNAYEAESLKVDSMEKSFEEFQNSNNKIQLEVEEVIKIF